MAISSLRLQVPIPLTLHPALKFTMLSRKCLKKKFCFCNRAKIIQKLVQIQSHKTTPAIRKLSKSCHCFDNTYLCWRFVISINLKIFILKYCTFQGHHIAALLGKIICTPLGSSMHPGTHLSTRQHNSKLPLFYHCQL